MSQAERNKEDAGIRGVKWFQRFFMSGVFRIDLIRCRKIEYLDCR